MKQITLPFKTVPVVVTYDDDDELLVAERSWYVHTGGYIAGTLRGKGARKASATYMHRLFMRPTGTLTVDHIDGNKANNQRYNLRCVPQSLNNLNQNNRTFRNNTHGFRGVSLHKPSGLWQARLTIGGVRHDLGYFKTAEDASSAYNASVQLWLPEQCLAPRVRAGPVIVP